jgi:hypothetical protein
VIHPELISAVIKAQLALHLNQRELGDLMQSSERTVQRWYAGRGVPYPNQITRLVLAVHPRDPDIARRLAAGIGQTLESLGVVAPPPPPAPPPPLAAAPPPGPSPLTPVLVESVVAAAAEALDVSPRVARPAVLAAFERARAAGVAVEEVIAALRPPAQGKKGRS